MTDHRLATLKKADPAHLEEVQKRYQRISVTIDDAVSQLQKIVDGSADQQVGQWVDPLKEEATSIKDSLAKAAARYHDVATNVAAYKPDLEYVIHEVAGADTDTEDAVASARRAQGMPDPQKGPDGTISPEEQQKAIAKQRAIDEAQSKVTAAKNRLTRALDALDVAGTRLGDAVNCKKYHDGLTDSFKDKVIAVFKKISEIFGIIAMVLTVLTILIPGVNVLAIAGIVAGAVLLVADSVLLGLGDGSIVSIVLDVFGLGLAGLAAAFGKIAKMSSSFKDILNALKFKPGTWGSHGPIPLPNWGATVSGIVPKPGFFASEWRNFIEVMKNWGNPFRNEWRLFGKQWKDALFATGAFTDITQIVSGAGKGWWQAWGWLNVGFNLGASLVFAGLTAAKNPAVEGTP